MLTKKHFEVIATALAKARPSEMPPEHVKLEYMKGRDAQWFNDVFHICEALKQINPRFDEDRFIDWINDMGRGRPGK